MKITNIIAYEFTAQLAIDELALNEALQAYAFKPCEKSQSASFGFVSPFGLGSETLYHRSNNQILLCAKKEKRPIPNGAVAEQLVFKNKEFIESTGRPLTSKEKTALKEDILHQLQPHAFSYYEVMWAFLDLERQRLLVAVNSSPKAEDFNSLLRGALGSLPVRPWGSEFPEPRTILTDWLRNGSSPFELGTEAELAASAGQEGVIITKHQSLDREELHTAIDNGKHCVKLGLAIEDKLSFVINENLHLKKVKIDSDSAEAYHFVDGTEAEKLDSDFSMWSLSLRELLDKVAEAFEKKASQVA